MHSSTKSRPYTLLIGKDYSISFKYNTSANGVYTPTIIIKGKNGLKGTLERPFTITKKDLSESDNPVIFTAEDVGINNKGKYTTKLLLTDSNGKKLSAGTDYDKNNIIYEEIDENGDANRLYKADTITLSGNDDVHSIRVTVFAKNDPKCNYTGSISTEYRVGYRKQLLKSAKVKINYGKELVNGREKNKTYFDYDPENAIIFDNPDSQLSITVNGKTLTWKEDYEIVTAPSTYINNTRKGTARVTIRGINGSDYMGTKVITFKIGARNFNATPVVEED